MGSNPLFHPQACIRCDCFVVEPCYPPAWVCRDCEAVWRSPFLAAVLRQRLGREPDAEMVAIIARFSAACRIRRGRLFFLEKVLLSRGSYFRKFTCRAGMSREDILDRIMSFV